MIQLAPRRFGRRGRHRAATQPDLVLLDLQLPRKNGYAVLAEKAAKILKHVPVIVLTGSELDEDILKSYAYQAYAYIQKPSLEPFDMVSRQIVAFWLNTARLPDRLDPTS